MYYKKSELLNFKSKGAMDKLDFEELRDIWWCAFDNCCSVEGGFGSEYETKELEDLYYIRSEVSRQIENRFKDRVEEFKSYVEREETAWQEECEEEGYL